ncbi:hypothetical protein BFF78_28575 [Streptomyces fodineus]|uniref:Uncharacterized protein n=1 Tax=Streptomyces fodineus TaxID=1904616 RepID=A0A1D7YFS3_9ACTN|nr:hypothetical protein BFF78_28575 [Streptomyces fodineus]
MKKALAGLAAAGLILTAAGTAAAAWSGPIPVLTSGGVEFAEGQYKFNAAGVNHGAFEWAGRLRDANRGDDHNVYMQVRVEGHDWVRYDGKQKRSVWMHHSNWDGAQRYTVNAYMRACRDRGSLRPDNCSPAQHFTNN